MCVKYGRKLPRLTISKRSTVNSTASQGSCFSHQGVLLILGLRQIRLQILSDLTASQAATEKSVITFRQQHLTEGLLDRQEVVEWITRQAMEDGPASRYLRVPIPDGYELVRRNGRIFTEPLLTISDTTSATQVEMELLSYASSDESVGSKDSREARGHVGQTQGGEQIAGTSLHMGGSSGFHFRLDGHKSSVVQLARWDSYGVQPTYLESHKHGD